MVIASEARQSRLALILRRQVRAIPVPSGLGGPEAEAAEVAGGPAQLLAAGLRDACPDAIWEAPVLPTQGPRLAAIGLLCRELASRVELTMASGALPLVVGGDHAIAAGTWRGVGRALGGPPGLIWLDAHLDAHTLESTPSGNPHGMPLAALLGRGAPELVEVPGPPLHPQQVCVIGTRSFETSEPTLLHSLGVRIFTMAEIRRRGLGLVFAEALAIVSAAGQGYGLSIDVDVINPDEAPGVETPARGGLTAAELLPLLRGLARLPACRAIELVEYDPGHDRDGHTATLVLALVRSLFGKPARV